MMYSTRPTLPTDKQAHVKRDELPNPMCRRNKHIKQMAKIDPNMPAANDAKYALQTQQTNRL